MGRRGYFQFKQFTIHQDRCAMKVTTDACMFGARVGVGQARHILDIGAGTGLLSLMAAQQNPAATVQAVELDPEAARQAAENFAASPWAARFHTHTGSIQHFQAHTPYDLIITNPPFFAQQLPSAELRKQQARHQTTLTAAQLAQAIARLLAPQGSTWVLLPPPEADIFVQAARAQHLCLHHTIACHSFAHSPAHLHMLCLGRQKGPATREALIYYTDTNKTLSPEAFTLLQPYYLYL